MATFLLTTTGTASPVVFSDLGNRSFTHPTVAFDLTEEYTIEELRDSEDLRAAVVAGEITATLDGEAINSGATFDSLMEDFKAAQVDQNTSDISTLQTEMEEVKNERGRKWFKVLDVVDPTAAPPTAVDGDRYALGFNAGAVDAGWNSAPKGSIVERKAGQYEVVGTPLEGDKVYADNINQDYRLVDDGTPSWQLINGELQQDATEVPYTPTIPADWNVAPDDVAEGLDELADRVETLEAGGGNKKSWSWSAGENGNLNGDRDLRRTGDMVGNRTPFIAPLACTIWGISIASRQGTNETFDIQVIKNGSAAHTESVSAADKKVNAGLAIPLVAGDEVYLRFIRTSGAVRDVGVEVYVEEA